MARIESASRAEYVGFALEEAIRRKVATRRWYRRNRGLAWDDWEHEANRELRLLFGVRREGIRRYQDQQRRLRRVWFEAVESAAWKRAELTPDTGDHFVGIGR